MNKIFLVITLCFFNYGLFSTEKNLSEKTFYNLGVGRQDCSAYLDAIEKGYSSTKDIFIVYAQGVIVTYNAVSSVGIELFQDKQFAPKGSMLERLITKHCEENVASNFHETSSIIWFENAK